MATSPARILDANPEIWPELDYVLEERRKPVVVVCTFDNQQGREAAIELLKDRCAQYKHKKLDTTGQQVISLHQYLEKNIGEFSTSEDGHIQHCIHITGLEHSLLEEKQQKENKLLPELNFERELIFREFPCILMLWLNHFTLKRLKAEAPDFWDWVQYQFHFCSPEDEVDREPVSYDDKLEAKGFTPERLSRVEDLETRYERLDQSGEDRERILRDMLHIQKLLGEEYLEVFELEKAEHCFKRALGLQSRLNDPIGMAYIYFQLGEAYRLARKFDLALASFRKAVELDTEYDNEKDLGADLHQMGMVFEEQKLWDQALEYYQKAIKWKEKTQQLHLLGSSYHQIGRVLGEQKLWDRALEQYQNAIEWNEKTQQIHELGDSYHQIGRVFEEQKLWDHALKHFQKAIEWKEKTQQLHQLGSSYHQIGRVFEKQKLWSQALEYYQIAIEWNEKTHQFHQLETTFVATGWVHKAQNDKKLAREWLQKALSFAREYHTGNTEWIQEELERL